MPRVVLAQRQKIKYLEEDSRSTKNTRRRRNGSTFVVSAALRRASIFSVAGTRCGAAAA